MLFSVPLKTANGTICVQQPYRTNTWAYGLKNKEIIVFALRQAYSHLKRHVHAVVKVSAYVRRRLYIRVHRLRRLRVMITMNPFEIVRYYVIFARSILNLFLRFVPPWGYCFSPRKIVVGTREHSVQEQRKPTRDTR